MRPLAALSIAICLVMPSCIVAVAPVHDESAVVEKAHPDHVARFSFANLYDRDSSGTEKPGGIRMFLKMHKVGPMNLKLSKAIISRDGGPWQACEFGQRAYNAGVNRPYDYSSIEAPLRDWNYFNVLILGSAETTPADRSRGYSGIDPLKRGTYRLRVSYTINSKNFDDEVELKLDRQLKAGVGTILDVVAPWSSMDG